MMLGKARLLLRPLAGPLVGSAAVAVGGALYAQADAAPPKAGLDPKNWVSLKLTAVTPLSSNTAIYRFAFDDPEATSGMTVASCLLTKAAIGSEKADGSRANVMRPYTPLSPPDAKGYMDLAVKAYPEGKMSKHFANMKVGDKLDFKGPILKVKYEANQYDTIGMVAGGTGITPMLQVIDHILANPADKTKVSLIFGNQTEDDILLKKEIDQRVKAYPKRLSVHYVVDKAPSRMPWQSAWSGGVGYVTKAMLEEKLPAPSARSMVYVCGPPPMYKAVCGPKGTKEDPKAQGELGGLLKDMGFATENVFKF